MSRLLLARGVLAPAASALALMTAAISAAPAASAALAATAASGPAGAFGASAAAAAEDRRQPRFPAHVTTIDGDVLDVVTLASSSSLVLVTLKATSCPVCQEQLARLERHAPELRDCGVRFMVLAPGPRERLAAIRERTDFPHPFVEDSDLKIAESLGLRMSEEEIVPGFLLIEPDLTIGWRRLGRSGANFGETALLRALECKDKLTI